MSFRKKAKAKLQRRIISVTRSGDGPPVNAEDISIDPWTDRVNRVTCPVNAFVEPTPISGPACI